MAIFIRTPSQSWSSQQLSLENTNINLELQWNDRASSVNEGSWFLNLYTVEDEPIITGIKIIPDYPLTFKYSDNRLPEGEFFCLSNTSTDVKLGRDNLGTDFRLTYITKEELDNGSIQT